MLSLPGVKYLFLLPPTCVWAHKHIRPERVYMQGKVEEFQVANLLFHTVRCSGFKLPDPLVSFLLSSEAPFFCSFWLKLHNRAR